MKSYPYHHTTKQYTVFTANYRSLPLQIYELSLLMPVWEFRRLNQYILIGSECLQEKRKPSLTLGCQFRYKENPKFVLAGMFIYKFIAQITQIHP